MGAGKRPALFVLEVACSKPQLSCTGAGRSSLHQKSSRLLVEGLCVLRPGAARRSPERAMLCFLPSRSLDRKPQRPLLGKSRTLPSIPQSPVLSRLPLLDPTPYREEMPEQKPYKKHSASDHQKGCTVPSTGECCHAGATSRPSVLGGLQNPFLGAHSPE